MLRRIYGPNREQVTAGRCKGYNGRAVHLLSEQGRCEGRDMQHAFVSAETNALSCVVSLLSRLQCNVKEGRNSAHEIILAHIGRWDKGSVVW